MCYREVSSLIIDTLNVINMRYETNHNKEEERKESKFSKRVLIMIISYKFIATQNIFDSMRIYQISYRLFP